MKKIKIIAFILPILAIAAFVALQSFQVKEQLNRKFLDPPEWFTYPLNGTDETDEDQYTIAPGFDPDVSDCGGGDIMCAVLAQNNGSDKPILDVSGSSVVTGSSVLEIHRQTAP